MLIKKIVNLLSKKKAASATLNSTLIINQNYPTMRKILLMFCALVMSGAVFGQLSGIYNIPTGGAQSYPSIRAAIADLNNQGVGGGGVTFNVAADYVESITDSLVLTAGGKSGGYIVFQKSGTGANPKISRTNNGFLSTSTLGGQGDAVMIFQGCDYVRFDGIDIATANQGIEYGYYIRRASATDGCRYVQIKNCTITMTKGTSSYVTGIYSSNNDPTSLVSSATGVTLTSVDGRHENVTITGNTIQNTATGIQLRGYNQSTPNYNFYDQNYVVGAPGEGNTIVNWAGGSTSTAYGIYFQYHVNHSISYNHFENAGAGGVNATGIIYGIYGGSGNIDDGTINVNYNNLVLSQGATSTTYYIYITTPTTNLSASNNNFSSGTMASTSLYMLYLSSITPNMTISGNSTALGINKTGSGTFYGIYRLGTSAGAGTDVISFNNISNITNSGSGTSYLIYSGGSASTNKEIFNNTVSTITNGTGSTYGIYALYGNVTNMYSNSVHSINAGGIVYAIQSGGTSSGTMNTYNNIIRAITTTGGTAGSSALYGLYAATATTNNLYKNQIYDLYNTGSTGTVIGFHSASGGSVNFYNNFISDLRVENSSSDNALVGINVAGGTQVSVFNNTVFLNGTSTSITTFGTSALYAASTIPLDLRNNILVNKSGRIGANGFTVAYRRNGAITEANYLATSDNNDLFAQSASPFGNYLFWDGTATGKDSTITDYKSRMAPRDASSFTEDPPFVNAVSAPFNLHLQEVQTKCESGASEVNSPFAINTDIDDQPRFPNPGYPENESYPATAPDVGADEFAGIPSFTCGTPDPGNTIASIDSLCYGDMVTLTLENPITGTGNNYQWQKSYDNVTYDNIPDANLASFSEVPAQKTWYRCRVTCQNGPVSEYSVPVLVNFAVEVTFTEGASRCGVGTLKLLGEGTGDTLAWYNTPTGGSPLGFGSPFTTPVISQTTTFYAAAEIPGTGVLQIGAGATTSATYSNPFYSLWSNTHNQHLIRASELNAAGLTAGAITALGLNITVAGTLPMLDFSLKIGQTTADNVASFVSTAFTTVYTSASFMPVVGINTMTFTQPFIWDGVSNLLIEICHGNPASTATMSRTCTADNTSYVSSIHTHITTSPGTSGTVICGDITTNKTTYSLRPVFIISGSTTCSGPRIPVLATVTPAPEFHITDGSTVCNDAIIPLTVTSPTAYYDTYIWSPVDNLYTDAAGTVPYTGTNVTTVYFRAVTPGAHPITCMATNEISFCANTDTAEMVVLPASLTIDAEPPSLCVSGFSHLTVTMPAYYGAATFQWQQSIDGINYSDINGATDLTYTTQWIGLTTWYKFQVKNSAGAVCLEPVYELVLNNPIITSAPDGYHCGPGVIELTATSTTGLLTWYSDPLGANTIGTGSTYTTPYLWESQTYYVAAIEPGTIQESAGMVTPTGTSTGTTQNYGMVFTTNENITLKSVDIYPTSTAGQIAVTLYNSSQTVLYGPIFFSFPAGNGTVPFNLPLDFQIVAGTGYRLLATTLSGGSLRRQSSGVTYPISNGTLVSMTAAASSLTGNSTTTYNYFYNFRVMYGCSSPLEPVEARIDAAPVYELSQDQSVCNNDVAMIEVFNGSSYYDNFTWYPVDYLFRDAACTIPYDSGTVATTLYLKTTNHGTYTIAGSAYNTVNGCTNFDTTNVTVLPSTLEIVSSVDTICISGSATLSLSPVMNYGVARMQWQISTDNVVFTDVSGATNATFVTPVINTLTYFRVIVKNQNFNTCLTASRAIVVDSPAITGTTGATRCGTGTVTLTATSTPGSTIKWYGNATGGTVLGTGPVFTTPPISATTTYYVRSVGVSGSTMNVGMAQSINGTSGSGANTYGLYFDALSNFTLETVNVYPNSSTNENPGTVTIGVINLSGTILHQKVVDVIGYTQSTNPNMQTVELGFEIEPASSLRLVMLAKSSTISGLMFQPSAQGPYPYPYTIPGVVSITSGTYSGNVYPSLYYYFYNWQISTTCSSPLVPVVAEVFPSNPVNITPNSTICPEEVLKIQVTSAVPDYDIYTWSPTTYLYTDAAATLPYLPQTNTTSVYFKAPVGVVENVVCNATNTINGCNDTATCKVTVIPLAEIISYPEEICVADSALLSLSPATGYGLSTFQWHTSTNGVDYTMIEGATNQTYQTPWTTANTWYKVTIRNTVGNICSEPVYLLNVNDPQVLSSVPGERCGPGAMQLEATVSEGAILNWYTDASGGTPIATGSPFTTPFLTTTTSFFAAASDGGSTAFVGKYGIEPSAGTGGGLSTYMNFSATTDFELVSVDLFPYGTGPGTITLQLRTSTGTTLMSKTFDVVGYNSPSTVQRQRVYLNWQITGGASYRLGVGAWTGGVSNLYRDNTNFSYPYTVPGVMSITGPSTSGYYYFFYNWQVSTGCESPRTEVLASVLVSPDLYISDAQTICTGQVVPVAVTSPLNQFDTYTWSPVDNLFLDAACTQPYTDMTNASTVYVKSDTGVVTDYVCHASNTTGAMCENYDTTTITVLPLAAITSQPEAICFTGTATLKLVPETGYGNAYFQWQESPDNLNFTDIPGATDQTYVTPVHTVDHYYKIIIRNQDSTVCSEPTYTMVVSQPTILSTTPGSRCGVGTVTLQATGNPGNMINWYAQATGGDKLGTGNTFVTPVISDTTDFYVEASSGASTEGSVGPLDNTIGSGGTTALHYYLTFDVYSSLTIMGVHVFPGAAGDVKLYIADNTGTELYVFTHPVTSGDVGVKTYVPLNVTLPAGTNYRMGWKTGGVSIYRNTTGSAFPYTIPDIVSITGHSFSGYPQYYYYFYDWRVLVGCVSARTAVEAIVTPPPAITATATPDTLCAAYPATLNVTSDNLNYTYAWMPGELAGPTQSVNPEVSTTYVVTATDAGTGCVNVAEVPVYILPTPSPVTITPPAPTISAGDIQSLEASGGLIEGSATFGTGTTTNTTTGYPAPLTNYYGGTKHQMLIRASELTAAGLFAGAPITSLTFTVTAVGTSFSGTLQNFQVDMAHTTETVLTSSAFIGGLTSARTPSSLVVAPGPVTIEMTTPFQWDGVSNLVIQTSYSNGNSGTSSEFVQTTYTDAGFVACNYYRVDAQSANYVLTYATPTGSSVNRPNMIIGYMAPTTYLWAPPADLYTDVAATIPYTGQSLTTVYTKPYSTVTYTFTATAQLTGCVRTETVTVTVEDACQMPLNPAVADITATTATFSWTEPAMVPGSGYEYEIRTSGDPGSGPVGRVTFGYTAYGVTFIGLTGLTENTEYHAYVRSNCGDNVYSTWTADYPFTTLQGVPENRTVQNVVVGTGQTECYDATNTITVAGGGTTFLVETGGSATFIAGVKILYLPGTTVQAGGYMLGKIAPSGPFCTPVKITEVAAGQNDQPMVTGNAFFSLFPNPTNGNFTLVQKGDHNLQNVTVEVFTLSGEKVLMERMAGQKREFRFADMPAGLYFVKVMADDYVETIKLVKTR